MYNIGMVEKSYSRKRFLKEGYLQILRNLSAGVQMAAPKRPPLRPPGAVAEPDFLELCNLCARCWEVCPHDAIKQAGEDYADQGYPIISMASSPCYLCDPVVCAKVCDEGALEHIGYERIKIGLAVVNKSTCLAYNGSVPTCDYCYDRCPLKGEAITYHNGPVINNEACTGCGLCEYYCVSNPRALKVHPL